MTELNRLQKLEHYLKGPSAVMLLIERVEAAEAKYELAKKMLAAMVVNAVAHHDEAKAFLDTMGWPEDSP